MPTSSKDRKPNITIEGRREGKREIDMRQENENKVPVGESREIKLQKLPHKQFNVTTLKEQETTDNST